MRRFVFVALLFALCAQCYSSYYYESGYCYEGDSCISSEQYNDRCRKSYRVELPAQPVEGTHDKARVIIHVADWSGWGLGIGGPCFLPFIPFPLIAFAGNHLIVNHEGLSVRFRNLTLERGGERVPLSVEPIEGRWGPGNSLIKLPATMIRKDLIISADDMEIEVDGVWKKTGPIRFELKVHRAIVLRFFNDMANDKHHIQWIIDFPGGCKDLSSELR